MTKLKTCSKCGIDKPITQYHRSSSTKDGRQSKCKLCNNSTAKRHYLQNDRKDVVTAKAYIKRKAIQLQVEEIKAKYKCCCCTEGEPVCLDFHHLDKTTKARGVAYWVASKSIKRVIEEINKCVVTCSNCHRKIERGIIPNPDPIHLCKEILGA